MFINVYLATFDLTQFVRDQSGYIAPMCVCVCVCVCVCSTDFRVLRGWCVGADMEEDLPVMHGSAVSMLPNMVQTVHITYPEFHTSVDIHKDHCSTN